MNTRNIFLLLFLFSTQALAESYTQLDTNVRQYQGRVEEKRRHLKELSEKKAELKDQTAIRAVLDDMIVDAKELKENFVKFQREKKRLMYEYPQKGDLTERQYKRFEIETTEEINTLSNIDLRLKGVLSKLEKTYEKAPEIIELEKKKKEKFEAEIGHTKTKPEHATSVKAEPSPSPARPKLTY